MATTKTYHITYDVKSYPKGILQTHVPKGQGAADALVVCSIIYPEEGGVSTQWMSMDGKTGNPIDVMDLFKVWALMAHGLSEAEGLPPGHREFAGKVDEAVREAIKKSREENGNDNN